MRYLLKETLRTRGAIDQGPDEAVEGSLLIGEDPVLQYEGKPSLYGQDVIKLFPAFYQGKRCWVEQRIWQPAFGYSASGIEEFILPFKKGVEILIKHEVFAFSPSSQEEDN